MARPSTKTGHRVRERYHPTQKGRVFERAARTHQIGRDDSFAVPRRQRMRGA